MTLTKERAIAYYHFRKPQSKIKRIRELGVVDKDITLFIINDNYLVRLMTDLDISDFMKRRPVTPRVIGNKLTDNDVLYFITSNHYYSKGEERL